MNLDTIYIIIDSVFKVIFSTFTVGSIFWYVSTLKRLKPLEKKIFSIQDDINNLEKTVHKKSGSILQSILDARVAKERKPLEDKLNTLKTKRQFILDKIPLIGFFKR